MAENRPVAIRAPNGRGLGAVLGNGNRYTVSGDAHRFSHMRDTRPEADAVRRAAILRRPPMQRLHDALRMSEELREVALSALRVQHPDEPLLSLVARLTGEPMVPGTRRGPVPGR